MNTENHHDRPDKNDSEVAPSTVLSKLTVTTGMTDYEYECDLEATQPERARKAQEAVWDADPDWQAFLTLCYSDTEAPDAAAIRQGVQHLIIAAQRDHAPAQCRLATELHLGEGRLGIKPDIRKAIAWYRAAAKNVDPIALQSLVVLGVTHPELMKEKGEL